MTSVRLQSCDWPLVMWDAQMLQDCCWQDEPVLVLPVKAGLCGLGGPSAPEVVEASLYYHAPSDL